MNWQHEHGAEYAVPARLESADLADLSWHNDTCPSFGVVIDDPTDGGVHDLRLWVDHPDPDQRECFGHRFAVNYRADVPAPDVDADDDLYDGDDLDAALAVYADARAKIERHVASRAAARS